MKLISIIVPVHNEERNIPIIFKELTETLAPLKFSYDYEIIFVNDASLDKSDEVIKALADKDCHVKYLEFSRNFGKESATSAGIFYAKGDAAIMLDADLQHPPKLVPKFIEKWEQGAEVVVGIREKNSGEGLVKKFGSFIFYALMSRVGHTKITARATDFRLIDRKVINEFNRFTERNRITRGLIDWLGFKKSYIYFQAGERRFGDAAYGIFKLVKLFFSAFVNHSLFPLKLAGYMGIVIILFSAPMGVFIFFEKYVYHDPFKLNFSGPAILGVLLLFLVGIILGCLGLIALYIASIHGEVVNRPMYVVREKKNLE